MQWQFKIIYKKFIYSQIFRFICYVFSVAFVSILLFKGFSLFGFLIFQFKNALTPLCLSRYKTKGHSGKNATLTPTKTLPKKLDSSPVIFQITLSTYKLDSFFKKKKKNTHKLDSQNKNTFFLLKKKPHHTRVARVMRLVRIKCILQFQVFSPVENIDTAKNNFGLTRKNTFAGCISFNASHLH